MIERSVVLPLYAAFEPSDVPEPIRALSAIDTFVTKSRAGALALPAPPPAGVVPPRSVAAPLEFAHGTTKFEIAADGDVLLELFSLYQLCGWAGIRSAFAAMDKRLPHESLSKDVSGVVEPGLTEFRVTFEIAVAQLYLAILDSLVRIEAWTATEVVLQLNTARNLAAAWFKQYEPWLETLGTPPYDLPPYTAKRLAKFSAIEARGIASTLVAARDALDSAGAALADARARLARQPPIQPDTGGAEGSSGHDWVTPEDVARLAQAYDVQATAFQASLESTRKGKHPIVVAVLMMLDQASLAKDFDNAVYDTVFETIAATETFKEPGDVLAMIRTLPRSLEMETLRRGPTEPLARRVVDVRGLHPMARRSTLLGLVEELVAVIHAQNPRGIDPGLLLDRAVLAHYIDELDAIPPNVDVTPALWRLQSALSIAGSVFPPAKAAAMGLGVALALADMVSALDSLSHLSADHHDRVATVVAETDLDSAAGLATVGEILATRPGAWRVTLLLISTGASAVTALTSTKAMFAKTKGLSVPYGRIDLLSDLRGVLR